MTFTKQKSKRSEPPFQRPQTFGKFWKTKKCTRKEQKQTNQVEHEKKRESRSELDLSQHRFEFLVAYTNYYVLVSMRGEVN